MTQDDVIIAPMRREDIHDVVAIEGMSFPSRWQPGAYETELMSPKSFYCVALQSTQVVGFAGMWTSHDEAHITTLAVHPDFRRRRIGRRLLRALLYKAADLAVERVTLEVRAGNQAAISLYGEHNFVQIAYLPRYYADTGEDGVIMWLKPIVLPDASQQARLVVLRSVHETMLAESFLKAAGVVHRIIPKPVSLGADCGLAITFEPRNETAATGALRDHALGTSIVVACEL